MTKDIPYILSQLRKLFPNPKSELNFKTPFQTLVAVVLSAQSTDKQVNKVTSSLFKKIISPQDVLDMGLEKFTDSIKSIGLFNSKAKNIYALSGQISSLKPDKNSSKKAKLIYKDYGYYVPDTLDEIMKLPGVGFKTAKVVLYILYKAKVVPVDTHIHRVANRIGLVKTKTPNQTSEELEKLISDNDKIDAHHLLILFGRYLCKARNPEHERCPIREICEYYKSL